MTTIDYKRIIKDRGLDFDVLANHIFPNNKYPKAALYRVLAGTANFDTDQVSKFAFIAGLTIPEVYLYKNWSMKSNESIITFKNGDYTAELNTIFWTTKVYHLSSIFHEEIIHSKFIPLSEYLENLNILIIKNQRK